jgi:hypothetical protein
MLLHDNQGYMMINKFIGLTIVAFSLMMAFQKPVYSIPTSWEDAKVSLSELLNSGWQMTAHGTNRIAANSSSGNGFDVRTYSFVLTRNGKYIICLLENPSPPTANAASCRRLN